ncbi:pilus assembly protein TadG-related protein [Paenibacillus sp. GCM10023252]|uniref:pilus assembly protein TadG-related protein n=1 Tax=Paenibacillus sp. GCM10023252 TaxID=3252649 RepID=UPI0036164F7C
MKTASNRRDLVTVIRNERGSMSLLAIGTLALVIVLSVYLFYFFTVFIEKRQAQNIADAASLTAVQKIKDEYEEAMQDKAEDEVLQFRLKYIGLLEPAIPGIPLLPVNPSIKLEDLIEDSELLQLIKDDEFDKREHWQLLTKEPFFADQFTPRKNGDLLYDVIRQESRKIEAAAREAVAANNGKAGGSLTFPVEGEPKFLLRATRTMELPSINLQKDIVTSAAAGISSKSLPIDVSGKAPFTIYW